MFVTLVPCGCRYLGRALLRDCSAVARDREAASRMAAESEAMRKEVHTLSTQVGKS